MAKIEKTAVEADQGEQSRGPIWNYRFVKIGTNIKSIDLPLLIQDMITQQVMESHYALGVKMALGRMDLLQIPRHSLI